MTAIILIFLLICLILFSAILSASETSLFSLSTYTINAYKHSADKRKKLISKLLSKPRQLLVTILMLNIFANILIQNTVSSLFGSFTSWILKVGVPLFLTLFFGEVIPKSLAMPNNKYISYKISPFIAVAKIIIAPVRYVLTKITNYISRFMFFFLKKEKPLSIEELHYILDKSKEKQILNTDESQLIGGYLNLHDSIIKEHMTPRDKVKFYDIQEPVENLIKLFEKKQIARVPVCSNEIDNVLGIISLKRFFFYKKHIKSGADLKKYIKKPFYTPEATRSYKLLNKLREQKESIAIVVDEYGSIAGLITQEDLVESVIGDISDKVDEKAHFTHQAKDIIIASGKMPIDELEQIFNVKLKKQSTAVTIGGFLTDELGDIPKSGDKLKKGKLLFYVLSAGPNKVKRVYIRLLKQRGHK